MLQDMNPIYSPQIATPNRVSADWKAWLSWLAATMIGIELLMAIVYSGFSLADSASLGTFAERVIETVSVVIGLAAYSACQWIPIRSHLPKYQWWVPATVLGLAMACGICFLMSLVPDSKIPDAYSIPSGISLFCVSGCAACLPQWLILRKMTHRSLCWLLFRPLGWLAGYGLLYLTAQSHAVDLPIFGSGKVFNRIMPDLSRLERAGSDIRVRIWGRYRRSIIVDAALTKKRSSRLGTKTKGRAPVPGR